MSDTLGVAVVGCGYWGANYIRIFSELPRTTVRFACDSREERLRHFGARLPGVRQTTVLSSVLEAREVDAVVVCTPAATHAGIIRKCIEAGKHVLVEKPLTTCSAEARDLVDLAAERDRVLMVGHTFLYNPAVRKIRSLLDAGDPGPVYYLYARRTNLGPIRSDVSALWDLAPHDISIFNYLLDGVPRWVSAVASRVLGGPREDVGFLTLGYAGGVIGHVHVSWAEPCKVREVVVVGRERRIVFDDMNRAEPVRVFHRGVRPEDGPGTGSHFRVIDGDIVSPSVGNDEPLLEQSRHFVDCITHGRRPLTDGQAGLAVVRILEAADASAAGNGRPVVVESPDLPAEAPLQSPRRLREPESLAGAVHAAAD